MANVNKIKQMAERHEYNLAVDILDSQNLERSLNPQFLRSCAEIYENVGRPIEARQLYVKAHTMAPVANRIILSIINYYLKRGFVSLAKRYYEEYEANYNGLSGSFSEGQYIMKKAGNAELGTLFDMLYPGFRDELDENWSFELFLVAYLMDKKEDYDILASDYLATFKNGYYCQIIQDILDGNEKADKYFYIYSEEQPDTDPAEENIRKMEEEALKSDYLRRNPVIKDAVITEMVDDVKTGSKFLKHKGKKSKENPEENESAEKTDTSNSVQASSADSEAELKAEEQIDIREPIIKEEDIPINEVVEKGIKSFIRKKFLKKTDEAGADDKEENEEEIDRKLKKDKKAKKHKDSSTAVSEAEADKPADENVKNSEESAESPETEIKSESEINSETENNLKSEIGSETETESITETKSEAENKAETEVSSADITAESDEGSADKTVSDEADTASASENVSGTAGESGFKFGQKLKDTVSSVASMFEKPEAKPEKEFISYDFDDGFAPESDSIADLEDEIEETFENPFDSIRKYKEEERYQDKKEDRISINSIKDRIYVGVYDENKEYEKVYEPEIVEDEVPQIEALAEEVEEAKEESVKAEPVEETEEPESFEPVEETEEPEIEAEIEPESFEPVEEAEEPEIEAEIEPESFEPVEETEEPENFEPVEETEKPESFESVEETEEPEIEAEIESESFESVEETEEPEIEAEIEPESFEPVEETIEAEIEPEIEAEIEPESFEPVEEAEEPEIEAEIEPESFEPVEETEEPDIEAEIEPESFEPVEETTEPEIEAEIEPESFEPVEETEEPESFESVEETEEPEQFEEVEEPESFEPVEETEEPEIEAEIEPESIEAAEESEFKSEFEFEMPKPSFDFPEFKTDLFPNINTSFDVENKFDEVASEKKSELDARLEEEEKKLQEAEALLASLGIKI